MRKIRKSTKLVVGTASVALVGGGVAFAYWTAGGSGTGSASTASGTQVLTAVQTSTVSNMRPGDSAQLLAGNFNNPNSGPIYVTSVTASIAGVALADGVTGTCDASDYTLANPVMTVATQVLPGNGQGSWDGATIKFNNKTNTNQDACKGATVSLAYTIN